MIDKRTTHYKEDLDHAYTELKRQDNDLRDLRKRIGAKNLEIAELKARVDELESSKVVMCLSELMRGLEIPAGTIFNDPVSLNMTGKAIAAQAKEANELTKKNINEKEFQRLTSQSQLLEENVIYWQEKAQKQKAEIKELKVRMEHFTFTISNLLRN